MTASRPKLQTLKKRTEFQRVRGGGRASMAAFVLEGKLRVTSGEGQANDAKAAPGCARFGFTITKKIGNAVVRNRIRRRLRAALVKLAPELADPGMDYVIVAREAAAGQIFEGLVADLRLAFTRVHQPARPGGQAGGSKRSRKP